MRRRQIAECSLSCIYTASSALLSPGDYRSNRQLAITPGLDQAMRPDLSLRS